MFVVLLMTGGVTDVGRGGEKVVLEDRVPVLTEGAEREENWAIAQFDVSGLSHDAICIRYGKVGEAAVVLLETIWALCIGLM